MTKFIASAAIVVASIMQYGCQGSAPQANAEGESPDSAAAGISILSNRSDLISGGNALIEVSTPTGAEPELLLNGIPIAWNFSRTANGAFIGLVEGLQDGTNTLQARSQNWTTEAEVINAPIAGPVFAGTKLEPWTCLNEAAVDSHCNQQPTFSFFYKSTDPTQSGMIPYEPTDPPNDVAETTTDQGVTVPFIVRLEQGYINRDLYNIAVLFQPEEQWTASAPQPQFNRKLLINHGFGCAVEYQNTTELAVYVIPSPETAIPLVGGYLPVGTPIPALPDATETALGAGYAVMAHALNNSKHNCNLALQAESIMMTKEHLIERYGELRFSIGQGCSGGSLAVQWIANAYPGIYQGILPTCSFPDAWSTASQFMDNHLTLNYFLNPDHWGTGVLWTPKQMTDVQGHISLTNAIIGDNAIFPGVVAESPCGGVGEDEIYDADTRPAGVRCTIMETIISMLGRRSVENWSAPETVVGYGFGGLPADNVGVQYGLSALQEGLITPAQFVDLNVKIGGLDIDANPTPERLEAESAHLERAYRTGLINVGNNLDRTAIIDCSGPDPGAFHDAYRTFTVRARLDAAHGHHNNHIVWEGPVIGKADNFCAINSFLAMDEWLERVETDLTDLPIADKLTLNKPEALGDACFDGAGQKLTDGLCGEAIVAVYGTPRTVAGDAITTYANKCHLQPISREHNYGPIPLSDAQWQSLEAAFPEGVCDYDLPPVGFQATIPWLNYGRSFEGPAITGGEAMARRSDESGRGWGSAAFEIFNH
ncbi:MAG: DUF6351 family protein [Pseudomonadota bacterium]|nr:DUF6351 family protein [Pseudomonadota bacterium]